MKRLYLECNMGAAGDMLTAALLELHPDPDSFVSRFNLLGIPGVRMEKKKVSRCGVTGTQVTILVNGQEESPYGDEHQHHHDHDHGHDHDHEHGHDHEHEHDHDHEHHHDYEHGHESEHHHHHEHDHDYEHDHDHDHGHDHDHEHCHDHEHHHEHEHDHEHDHGHHHEHHSLSDITKLVEGLSLGDKVKENILSVYRIIAEAESKVHDRPLTEIHFHEVGTMDAIADVTAVCMLMEELKAEEITASPVCTGSGTVRCAHGILPVPAPATAHILRGIPAYSGEIRTELCTPTGAALLKHFASSFGPMPVMCTESVGYGCGRKEFESANVVRAFLGNSEELGDTILELECNLDDMTGEEIGFACEELLREGARDVFTVPVQMKKNRPGVLLKVLCDPEERERIAGLIFRHTTTIGIRQTLKQRFLLKRTTTERESSYGAYTEKESRGFDVVRTKAEYEDLARIAREKDLSLIEVKRLLGN